MYINKIHIAGAYALICNYTPRGFGSHTRKRRLKLKDTTKAMNKYNNQRRAEKLQLLMLQNFSKGYHVILDYPLGNRPETYEEAEENLKKCLYKISRRLKRQGKLFKYIAITERGKRREALHHHMIIEKKTSVIDELSEIWGNHIKIFQMYEEGAYKDLAAYFCKIETKEEQAKGKSKYHRSRNLKEPKTVSRIVAGALSSEPYIPKDYEMIQGSYIDGFNEFAGVRFQKYMIKKLPKAAERQSKAPKETKKGIKKCSFWERIKKVFRKEKQQE